MHFKDTPGFGSEWLSRLFINDSRQSTAASKEIIFEALAAKFFENQGAKIKLFNAFIGKREIDFIMELDGEYYFVEAKEHDTQGSNAIIHETIKEQIPAQMRSAKILKDLGLPIKGMIIAAGGPHVQSTENQPLGVLMPQKGEYPLPLYTMVLPPYDVLAQGLEMEPPQRPNEELMSKWASERIRTFRAANILGWILSDKG